MKIGVNLTQLFAGRIGGTETYIRGLLERLQAVAGEDEFRLFCLSDNGITLSHPRFQKVVVAQPRSHPAGLAQWAARQLLRPLLGYDPLGRRLQRERTGCDVLHYPFSTLWPSPPARPAVVTMHDIQHEFHPEFFSARELAFRREYYPAAARTATRVIAVSEFTRQAIIEKYGAAPERVVAMHYGLDHDRFRQDHDPEALAAVKARYALPERFLFYPANFWPHKNHAGLLRAVKQLKDEGRLSFKLVLAGLVYTRANSLPQQLGAAGLTESVLHLGHVPLRDVALIYPQALGLVFPSLYEGFGAPILEAMASAGPVLCSTAGSLPEVAGGAALAVDATDTAALATALERLAADGELRRDLAARGLVHAADFNWQDAARRTLAVYHEAAP